MEHIGIRDHHMPRLPHGTAGGGRRVAVVGKGFNVHAQEFNQFIQFRDLIGGQGFGGKKIQRPGVGVLQYLRQYGQVIAEGFPRSRGRHHHVIHALLGRSEAFRLVGVQLLHAVLRQSARKTRVDALRPGRIPRSPWRHRMPGRHVFHKIRIML